MLCSLETEEAWPFYQSNLDCGTQAQTNAVLFSPNTMVIRNLDLSVKEDPFPVAVMTVSAPIASRMEPEELFFLDGILIRRIRGMLRAAIAEGYTRLVLGAWGCGNFGNNAEQVGIADGSGVDSAESLPQIHVAGILLLERDLPVMQMGKKSSAHARKITCR